MEIYYLDKTLKKASAKDLPKIQDKPLWIDLIDIKKEEAELLGKTFDFHALTTEDLMNKGIRIKVEEFNKYLFCVFYGVQMQKSLELVEMDFVIGKNYVISNHLNTISSFEDLKKNKEKLANLFKKGPDFVFHDLLDGGIDDYFPILEHIDDQIEKIEETITKKVNPESMTKILKLKRQIILVKKATFSQREKIGYLAKNEYNEISKKSLPYFRDVYDHAIRVSDSVDNYREAIGNTFDVYMSAVSNSMNEVMKVLSIIATIALPLTVISGIYGTNFTKLPGAAFGYGFWAMIFSMVLMVIGMLYFFRRRGWF